MMKEAAGTLGLLPPPSQLTQLLSGTFSPNVSLLEEPVA